MTYTHQLRIFIYNKATKKASPPYILLSEAILTFLRHGGNSASFHRDSKGVMHLYYRTRGESNMLPWRDDEQLTYSSPLNDDQKATNEIAQSFFIAAIHIFVREVEVIEVIYRDGHVHTINGDTITTALRKFNVDIYNAEEVKSFIKMWSM